MINDLSAEESSERSEAEPDKSGRERGATARRTSVTRVLNATAVSDGSAAGSRVLTTGQFP